MAPVRLPTAGRLLLALALLAAGCSGIAVHKAAKSSEPPRRRKASALVGDDLSPRSLQTLRRLDLEEAYRRKPADAAAQLHALALQDPQPEFLFALAELSYLQGKRAEQWDCAGAVGHYYLCAGYAYHYLFACARANRPAVGRRLRASRRRPAGPGRPVRPALPPGLRPLQRRPVQVHRRRPARRPARPAPRAAPAHRRRRRLHPVGRPRRLPVEAGGVRPAAALRRLRGRGPGQRPPRPTASACRSSPSAPPTPRRRNTNTIPKTSVSPSPPSSASTAAWPSWASAAPAGWSCTTR